MTPKRGDRVAPPAGTDEWEVRFGNSDAAKGWDELCQQAPTNTKNAWRETRSNPAPSPPTPRHHQLKGKFSYGEHRSRSMPCWQIEGRIWYLLDTDNQTVWVTFAGTAYPKATD